LAGREDGEKEKKNHGDMQSHYFLTHKLSHLGNTVVHISVRFSVSIFFPLDHVRSQGI